MTDLTTDERAELEYLRARVAQIEQERAEQVAAANAAVASLQERVYWLDRWHVDLNALMATRRGAQFRALVRAARAPVRRVRLVKRRLLG